MEGPQVVLAALGNLPQFMYSGFLLYHEGEILRIHVGLIARNELAYEFKRDEHYVIHRPDGPVDAGDVSGSEYNEHFDAGTIEYCSQKNPYDQGVAQNCVTFWCAARWPTDAAGDF